MADRGGRRLEFFLCVVVLPAVLLAVLYIPMRVSGLGASADFLQFYAAGKIALSSQRAQLYDPVLQSDVEWKVVQRDDPMFFNHPPFEAILYSPLACFSYATAFRVWTFLNLSLLGLVFFLLRPYGPPFGLAERLLLLAAVFHPILAVLLQGQDSLWILLGYVVAFLALKRGRDFVAGLLLGIGFVKPQLIVPFTLLLLLRGRWKFIGGLSVAAAILTAVSMLVVGPSIVVRYPLLLLHMNDQGHAGTFHLFPETMPNLRGLLTLLFGTILSPLVLNLVIGILSIAVLLWAHRRTAREQSFDLSFSLALMATLLVSFHLLIHDLSLLLLPAFLFLSHLQLDQPSWTLSKILRVAPLPALFLIFFILEAAGQRNFSIAALAILWFAVSLSLTHLQSSAEPAG